MEEMRKVTVESAAQLRTWLRENHRTSPSVWLIRWKKGSGMPYIEYDELVDQLLCFGWVDSLPRKLDHRRSMLRISPRNPKSNWSAKNKERVEVLLERGMMEPAGMKLVEEAKRNGAWDFLDDVDKLIIPPDLASAFDRHPGSEKYFMRFPDSSKRGILEWIKNARMESTRRVRIEKTAQLAAQNIKANHPKGRNAGPKE